MSANPRLLVPLNLLPAVRWTLTTPVGWPIMYGERSGLLLYYCGRLGRGYGRDHACVYLGFVRGVRALEDVAFDDLALDLSPPDPPLSRVDGLDVAYALLGWHHGDEPPTFAWGPGEHGPESRFACFFWRGCHPYWVASSVSPGPDHVVVPALANINPADPLARRLAPAAVLWAGGAS
jgi:hypothetical protein